MVSYNDFQGTITEFGQSLETPYGVYQLNQRGFCLGETLLISAGDLGSYVFFAWVPKYSAVYCADGSYIYGAARISKPLSTDTKAVGYYIAESNQARIDRLLAAGTNAVAAANSLVFADTPLMNAVINATFYFYRADGNRVNVFVADNDNIIAISLNSCLSDGPQPVLYALGENGALTEITRTAVDVKVDNYGNGDELFVNGRVFTKGSEVATAAESPTVRRYNSIEPCIYAWQRIAYDSRIPCETAFGYGGRDYRLS